MEVVDQAVVQLPQTEVRRALEAGRRRSSQNFRLVAAILNVILLLYAAVTSWYSWVDAKGDTVRTLATVAELEARALDSYFSRLESTLKSIGGELTASDGTIDLDRGYVLIRKFLAQHTELFNVTLIQADGAVLATAKNAPGTIRASLAREPSFIRFVEELRGGTELSIGQPLVGVVSKVAIVPVRLAIKDSQGNLRYVLSANLPQEHLRSFWMDAPIVATAAVGLIRDNGFLLSRYPVPAGMSLEAIYGQPRTGALMKHLAAARYPTQGYVQGPSSLDGPDFITAYRRLPNHAATLFVTLPMAEVRAMWWERVGGTYFALAFLLLSGIAVYQYAQRRQRAANREEDRLLDAQHQSEQRFRSLVDKNNAVILQIDPVSGRILDANAAAAQFYGWTHDALCAMHIQDINQLDAARVASEMSRAKQRSVNYFVFPHRLANGETRTVEVHSTPIEMPGGIVLVSIIHDITDRVRAAAQIDSLIKEQQAILNRGVVGFVKLQGRTLAWANDAFAQMFGYSTFALLGQSSRILYPDNDAFDALGEAAYPAMRMGRIFRAELELRRKDGERAWCEVAGGMLDRDGNDSIWAFVDVTRRKVAEVTLSRSEEFKDAILNSVHSEIAVLNPKGVIVATNEAWRSFARENARDSDRIADRTDIGLDYLAICMACTGEGRQFALAAHDGISRVLAGQLSSFALEYPCPSPDRERWFTMNVTPLGARGAGAVVAHTDITKRKQMELELEQHREQLQSLVDTRTRALSVAKDAAEAANRAKSTFLATMSHELRTPLNGIMGMMHLAAQRATDPKQADWLGKSLGSAKHLLSVINDILDLSRIDADRVDLEVEGFTVRHVVDATLQTHGDAARAKGLQLGSAVDPAVPELLTGDATRVQQILLNFVSNAIKFSPRGQVVVRVDVAEEDARSVMLRITVTDQGIGIRPEQLDQLFQPFAQADGSPSRQYGGSGLGLAISKRFARLMGGDAGVESEYGTGSSFWATVRLQRAIAVGATADGA